MSILTGSDHPIRSREDLLTVFHESAATRDVPRIGPELEKCGVHPEDFSPVSYAGDVIRVLENLEAHAGYHPDREREGGPLIALEKNGASVTLEPGAQLELSGAPAIDVHAIDRETREHARELRNISNELGIAWLGIGFHPFAQREDLSWVPKSRYQTMREYFPNVGKYGLDMMLRTCTVQANLDYGDEADAMETMRLALAIAPLTTAIFANSPWLEGKPIPGGGVTMRGLVWTDVDPSRSGLLPALWKPGARYEDYVAWALEAPMFILKRKGEAIPSTDQTFADYLTNGRQTRAGVLRATDSDWRLHLNTLFPEVRLKRTIEIRGADAQSAPTVSAIHALFVGLFYDPRARADLAAMVESWTYDEVNALRPLVWRDGLRTIFRSAPLADQASRLIEIAKGGLERRARKNSKGEDESIYLIELGRLAARAKTPADVILDAIGTATDDAAKRKIIELTDLVSLGQ